VLDPKERFDRVRNASYIVIVRRNKRCAINEPHEGMEKQQ
jgi:hypothetical protein